MTTTPFDDTMVDSLDASTDTDPEFGDAEATGNRVTGTVRNLASSVTDAAAGAAPKINEAMGTTAGAVREADRMIGTTSDQGLGMIGALSIGSAMGLLVGGANRFLVALSLVPAIMVAKAVVDRMDRANARDAGQL